MLSVVEPVRSSLEPSPLLVAFVKRLIRNAQIHAHIHTGPERRNEQRQGVALPAVVQPMDEQRRPIGPPIAMVTHSLSTRGIGLVHEQQMPHDHLAVQLFVGGEEVVLAGEVRWRFPLGPYYSFGCEVNAKLDQFPCVKDHNAGVSSAAGKSSRFELPACGAPGQTISLHDTDPGPVTWRR